VKRVVLNAKPREKTGTSAVKKLRSKGLVPAVVYAREHTPLHITIDRREFVKLLHKEGENAIIDLNVGTESKQKKKTVIIKDIQYDTIKEGIFHIDFQQIKLTEKIRVYVPIVTKGDADAPGVKEGGILEHILREVEVECLPTNIPKEILIDVSNLQVGEPVCVKDLNVDPGLTLITDKEQVAVMVKFEAEEKAEEEKPETEEETAEPEVIKKGKPEEAEAAEEEK